MQGRCARHETQRLAAWCADGGLFAGAGGRSEEARGRGDSCGVARDTGADCGENDWADADGVRVAAEGPARGGRADDRRVLLRGWNGSGGGFFREVFQRFGIFRRVADGGRAEPVAMAEHDAAWASAAGKEGAAGFEEGEQGATARGRGAGEEYFCDRALHVMRCGSAVQLPQRRGDEREVAGGGGYPRVRFGLGVQGKKNRFEMMFTPGQAGAQRCCAPTRSW